MGQGQCPLNCVPSMEKIMSSGLLLPITWGSIWRFLDQELLLVGGYLYEFVGDRHWFPTGG